MRAPVCVYVCALVVMEWWSWSDVTVCSVAVLEKLSVTCVLLRYSTCTCLLSCVVCDCSPLSWYATE